MGLVASQFLGWSPVHSESCHAQLPCCLYKVDVLSEPPTAFPLCGHWYTMDVHARDPPVRPPMPTQDGIGDKRQLCDVLVLRRRGTRIRQSGTVEFGICENSTSSQNLLRSMQQEVTLEVQRILLPLLVDGHKSALASFSVLPRVTRCVGPAHHI